jgi:hypothetical protein
VSKPFKRIVSSHMNPNLSGVAKFNAILADTLGTDCVSVAEGVRLDSGPLLLSLKLGDNGHSELERVRELCASLGKKKIAYDLFLHTFDGLEAEYELVEGCRRVFCGNKEIAHALEGLGKPVVEAWCPALVNPSAAVRESKLNLFSFGMAHKIQINHYKALHGLLESHGAEYSLWVSTAFHEKANFGDFNAISRQLSDIFDDRIQFLGFLSDEAVNYFLGKTQLFVSFFPKGVRANNTSVSAAMGRGCVVLTNCDEYSPGWIHHGVNVLDILRVRAADLEAGRLKAVGENARLDAAAHASWKKLERLFGSADKRSAGSRRRHLAAARAI